MEIDKSNMREVILTSPKQLKIGLELAKDVKVAGNFKNIIICGIGGSALPANVLDTIAKPNIPLYIHLDYNLPNEADENSLIICISYSGTQKKEFRAWKKLSAKI